MYKPGSQKALEESMRRQRESAERKGIEDRRRSERKWKIYMEVKDWLAISLSVAALAVSIIALLG